ncbi:MAG: tail fiber domain-containing protein [Bacteroidota bacterium]
MKRTIISFIGALLMLMIVGHAYSQVPQAFNYQAVARNSSGALLASQTIGLKLTIHQGSSSGTIVYSETHSPTTNQFGLFTVALGQGTVVSGTFSAITWSTGNYWLQVQMDPTGGTTYANMGTDQLLTVPFAMYAANAGTSGTTGATGATGPAGLTGPAGANGATGPAGANGATGLAGVTGPTGPAGSGTVNGTTNYVAKFTSATAVGNSIMYDNGSRVLVGTTTPFGSDILQVQDAIAVNNSLNPTLDFYVSGTYTGFVEAKSTEMNMWAYDPVPMHFGTNSIRRLTIDGQGRVGIGTTTPNTSSLLNVKASKKYAGYFTTDTAYYLGHAVHAEYTNTGSYDGVAVYGKSNAADWYGYGGYFESKYIGVYSTATNTSVNSLYGVYGYATSSAAAPVYGVYGYAATTGGTAYGLYCSGNGAYTGTWTLASDEKFKKDVTNYSSALDNVLKLRPVSYSMKTEEYPFMGFASGKQIGFIAQEMEKVFPTLVENGVHPGAAKEDPDVKYKGVNYIGLIPVLVKAMQEQNAKIEQLENRIVELESK